MCGLDAEVDGSVEDHGVTRLRLTVVNLTQLELGPNVHPTLDVV